MNPNRIVPLLVDWFARNARDLPWRRTQDPYAIWVSEIMLQQTQVRTVLPYWERWMRALPTIRALAKAKPEKLHKLWEGLGYYSRVRNMQRAAQTILRRHGGKFPNRYEEVLELPGIGRYTAGAICSIAFGQPKPVVDGNVIRVLTRVFGIDGDPRGKQVNATLWHLAEELVNQAAVVQGEETGGAQRAAASAWPNLTSPPPSPRGEEETTSVDRPIPGSEVSGEPTVAAAFAASNFNQALMELGALVCTPRQPRCESCPVVELCAAFQEQRIDNLPAIKPRVATSLRRFVAFVVEKRGRVLVWQRPEGGVNAHLWEFPNVEITQHSDEIKKSARKVLRVSPKTLKRLCSIKHTITRYRITLDAYYATGVETIEKHNGLRWFRRAELKHRAFTSAHRKVLMRLVEGREGVD